MEKLKNFKIEKKTILLSIIFLIFGLFISSIVKYGDDADTYALILSYLGIIEKGIYSPSRFYGSPLAEIIIGFFSYNFGGQISSYLCYVLYLISLICLFSYFKNERKENSHNKIYFIILAISNPILLFDNSNPSDFPLALFFFSAGILTLKCRFNLIACLLLGFSIACRANYAAFVYLILLFHIFSKEKKNYNDKIFAIINTSVVAGLFYLPILIQNKFKLNFIKNTGGPSFELYELLPRFFYKIYLSIGIYSSILFIILLFFIKQNLIKKIINKYKKEIFIIILNLLIFFFIPSKTAIISLSILMLYLITLNILKRKIILILILCNIIYWIVGYKILNITYKSTNKCDAIQAADASFTFKLEKGFYLIKKEKIKIKMNCDSNFFNNKKKNYMNGEKLSFNNAARH
jgi:hypothetical protein